MGSRPAAFWMKRGGRRAVRLHADGVEHRVRPAAAGHVADGVAEVVLVLAEVDDLDAAGAHALEPLGHQVDADHAVALVLGDPAGEVTDRAQAEDDEGAALGHVRVLHALPGGRQDVGEVGEPVVRRALGQLDVGELGLRHPQVLGLAAGHLAVELGEAEQRRAHALVAHLRRLALRVEVLLAHPAVPAGDLERDGDAVADLQVAALRADLDDLAHVLVAEDVAVAHERGQRLVEVQVGAADVRRRDPDDRVGRGLDERVGHLLDPNVALPVPGHCLHVVPPSIAGIVCGRVALSVRRRNGFRGNAPLSAARSPASSPSRRTAPRRTPGSRGCRRRRRSSTAARWRWPRRPAGAAGSSARGRAS